MLRGLRALPLLPALARPGRALLSTPGTRALSAVPSDFNVLPPEEAAQGNRPALVEAYDEEGFTVGGLDYSGSVICLGKSLALLWSGVRTAHDITPDRLAVFQLVRPRPELLLIGTGQAPAGQALPKESRDFLSSLGIKVDVQSTRHAAATHNFLSEDGRSVATALLPHGSVS